VWGAPLNATDFQNAKKVLQDVNITEKTRQAIRDGIESGKNFKGEATVYNLIHCYWANKAWSSWFTDANGAKRISLLPYSCCD
jgi:hypothetical protein